MSDVQRHASEAGGGGKRITTVEVGDRLHSSEDHTLRCVFNGFESLPHDAYVKVESEPTRIHGHLWFLRIHPGGDGDSSGKYVSLYLVRKQEKDDKVLVSYEFRIPGVPRSESHAGGKRLFAETGWGFEDFVLREDVLNPDKKYLNDGALTVEVDIRIWAKVSECWTPPINDTLQSDMLHVLETAKFADVTFVVQGKKFPVHRNVIAKRAPVLAAFFKNQPANSEIPLSDSVVDVASFELLMSVVYGGDLPPAEDLQDRARPLLCAANFCGLTTPKLVAESILAESVDVDNAAELLTLADANSCALLKEVAIDFVVANQDAVRATEGWADVKESSDLMDELFEATQGKTDPLEEVDVDRMCVGTLRRKLGESGLDMDGSRVSLVKRLKGE